MLASATRAIMMMLTLLYTFLVAGSCSPQPPKPVDAVLSDIPQDQPKPRTMTILQSRGEISRTLQEAVELYLATRPDVEIYVQTIGNEAGYHAALRSRLLAGEQVDLFHIFGYREVKELEGRLEDLSTMSWAGEAMEGIMDPVTVGEAVYGIPYSIEGMGLIANSEIFDAADIPLSGIVTFEDMEEAFKSLREKITLGELAEDFPDLKAVTELPAGDNDFLGNQLADVGLGGEFSSAQQAEGAVSIAFANDTAMGKYVDLLARYATNGRSWQSLLQVPQTGQVENGLAAGRVAVIQQSVRVYENILRINPELEGKLRLLPVPLEGAEHGYIYTSAPAFWAVNAASDQESKDIAVDFLNWLYRSETGAALVADRFAAASAYRETAKSTDIPLHRQMLQLMEQGRSLPRYYREFPDGWAAQGFAATLRVYFSEREYTWEEAAAKVREDWTAMR